MTFNLCCDVLLKLRLLLVDVHVVKKIIIGILRADSHELGLATMTLAVNVLHNLVIGTQLFSVLGEDAVHAIDSCVSNELLEVLHNDEVGNIRVKDYIVSHANSTIVVLIVLSLTDSVWETPRGSTFAIGLDNLCAFRFIKKLMPADIDEGLLVEELLLVVTDHLLGSSLDTEAADGLDKFGTNWQLTSFLHLAQVLIMLWPMFRIRDFIDILAHEILEFSLGHSFSELVEFFMTNVHLFSLDEGMVDLLLLFFGFWIHANPVEVFRCVRIHFLLFSGKFLTVM